MGIVFCSHDHIFSAGATCSNAKSYKTINNGANIMTKMGFNPK